MSHALQLQTATLLCWQKICSLGNVEKHRMIDCRLERIHVLMLATKIEVCWIQSPVWYYEAVVSIQATIAPCSIDSFLISL